MKVLSKQFSRFIILLLLYLIFSASAEVFAEDDTVSEIRIEDNAAVDVVYDVTALAEWLTAHQESGGRVMLGATVIITNNIYINGTGNLIIDTGNFSLILKGGEFVCSYYENLLITGEGVDTPVLDYTTWEVGD